MVSLGYRTSSSPAQPFELVITAPAGGVSTTASDMTRFMLAYLQQGSLDGATILRSETVQLMHTPSVKALPGFAMMAHGFFHEIRNGRTFIGHGGDTIYFHSDLGLLPDEGVGIFCSFNSRGRDEAVYGLRKTLFEDFLNRYFPPMHAAPEVASLATAPTDAQKIAGRYESSRRVEHGFLSLFYLLQQEVIGANADGTIDAPNAFEPGPAHFHEIAPDVWQQIGGTRQLALANVDGVRTVVDSDDPTSVLQAVPAHRSAPLNLTILGFSLAIATGTMLLWPIAFFVRRHHQRPLVLSPEGRRWRIFLRLAVLFDVLWLVCWSIVLTPVLSIQVDFYSTALDPVIRTLQIAGAVVVVLAAVGLWGFWRLCQLDSSRLARFGNGAIATMLVGLVWIGVIGGLISFDLNY